MEILILKWLYSTQKHFWKKLNSILTFFFGYLITVTHIALSV